MSNFSDPIVFRVSGEKSPDDQQQLLERAPIALQHTCRELVKLRLSRDTSAVPHTLSAIPERDVVVLQIQDGPTLVLHPQDASDLLSGSTGDRRDLLHQDAVLNGDSLPWAPAEANPQRNGMPGRGVALALEWISIVRRSDAHSAAGLAIPRIVEAIDGAVKEGLYRLSPLSLPSPLSAAATSLSSLPSSDAGQRLLVFIHGTFVNTASTFGKLWSNHADVVQGLFKEFKDRVYALEHATIGAGPIDNALTLARALPEDAELHLVCHSRAGLLAEVLVRACADDFGERDLQAFSGTPRDRLAELRRILVTKRIRVARVVRVACPARGTLLASRRLDAYLSVFQWLLRASGLSVTPDFLDFLYEVALHRTSPADMAGLEAMMPGSSLIDWINTPASNIRSELRVIAGDSRADSIGTWVKKLIADSFYWTDNDLVVQTSSMYGGAPRSGAAPGAAMFFLEHGRGTSHFNYFSQDSSVEALRQALHGETSAQWQPIGRLSWQGRDSSGARAAASAPPRGGVTAAPPVRPLLLFIGDLCGAHLAQATAAPGAAAPPDLLSPPAYSALLAHLRNSHEVQVFAYSLVSSMEEEARRLADHCARLVHDGRALRLLAHGAGALLVRVMHLERRDTWHRLMAHPDARLLMLAPIMQGSWSPMQLLSGDDPFDPTTPTGAGFIDSAAARQQYAEMQGLLQLQAGMDAATAPGILALHLPSSWQTLARDDLAAMRRLTRWHTGHAWGLPPPGLLQRARELRQRLDQQLPHFQADPGKMASLLGSAAWTPQGFALREEGVVYEYVGNDGDGSVTRANAMLAGVDTWRLPLGHDALLANPSASTLRAIVELLESGRTDRLERYLPSKAGEAAPALAARQAGRPSHASARDTWQRSRSADGASSGAHPGALLVQIEHSNLKFTSRPLLVGHYQALSVSGAEAVVDGLLKGRLRKAIWAGLYPEVIGSSHVFDNDPPHLPNRHKRMLPRPRAVIVVGLGEEGKLKANELSYTVRLGVLAYAQRLAEQATDQGGEVAPFDIAATLIGSGGSGVSVGHAALSVVQGVIDANVKLSEKAAGWPSVKRLTLVELYLDRATDAWRVLKLQSAATPDRLQVEDLLKQGGGSLRRPIDSSYRGATYDFISALQVMGGVAGHPSIAYSLDTKRARTEVRALHPQGALVRELSAKASNLLNTDSQLGRTLFQLLVPIEIEPYLVGSHDMVIELDAGTAAIPWELLDTDANVRHSGGEAALPWAIRSKLIRKLRVEKFRTQVIDATAEDNLLIIGEPKCDPAYGRLPGAQREARAVFEAARNGGAAEQGVTLLAEQNDAQTIINALFERNYRAIHVAGHGMQGPHGGVVLSGQDTFLGAAEMRAMRVTPELVFLNCCHLARREAGAAVPDAPEVYDRSAFAANVAEELILAGVRCVIAAGWAVEDVAAAHFAQVFYAQLFGGARFIDAVGAARRVAWESTPRSNTWAAYQCYGDPEWSWRRDSSAPAHSVADEYAGIAAPSTLVLVLNSFTTEVEFDDTSKTALNQERLAYLESTFAAHWGSQGLVAEAYGRAHAALQNRDKAMKWLSQAIEAADGGASLAAMEDYAIQLMLPGCKDDELKRAIRILHRLNRTAATLKRLTLMATAYKRRSTAEPNIEVAQRHLVLALKLFEEAANVSCEADNRHDYYPLKAMLACRLRTALQTKPAPAKVVLDDQAVLTARRKIHAAAESEPTFWSIVAQCELDLIVAVADANLQSRIKDIFASLADLRNRISTPRWWAHVHDEALFVLTPYLRNLEAQPGNPERGAAQELLERLRQYNVPQA